MKLSLEQRTELALRALRLLHRESQGARAKEMAPRLNTSVGYLPQVLRPLVRVGWVASEPGPNGGYSVAIDLDQVSILDLIEVMEGPTDSNTCVLQGGPCGGTAYCALHVPWLEARQGLIDRLSEVPILETSERKE